MAKNITLTLTQAEQIIKQQNCYKPPDPKNHNSNSIVYCTSCPTNNKHYKSGCLHELINIAHKKLLTNKLKSWLKI